MNQKELKQEIDENNLKRLYIFCSDDYFLKKLYLKRISDGSELKIKTVDIYNEDELYKIEKYATSKELFSKNENKIIHAKLHFTLSNINIKESKENIIIIDPIECKNVKHKNIVKFAKPTTNEIINFIRYKLKISKKQMDNVAANNIIDNFSDKDTAYLNNFLDKLLLYTYEKEKITTDDVSKCIINSPKNNIFELIRHIIKKDKDSIFDDIDTIFQDVHPSIFISIMTNELQKAIICDYLDKDSATKLGINCYKKYINMNKNIDYKKLIDLVNILSELDLFLKSSNAGGFNEMLKLKLFAWINS